MVELVMICSAADNVRQAIVDEAYTTLSDQLGDRVTRAIAEREHHSRGESHHVAAPPDIVCFPRSTEEVSEILKISARFRLPVIPYGAGTSVEGQVNALQGGITISLREMNNILQISAEDMDSRVQAGVTRLQLGRALKDTGVTFFIDPGADATLGGMVATRASGTTAVRYGTMRENVLGLTVVLADGRVIQTGSRARKSAAGYDLTHLFVGSEGTLGVITEVQLRLHILPSAISAAVCAFQSTESAVQTAIRVMQYGIGVARLEFVDDRQMDAINRFSKTDFPVLPHLFFEFHGMNERDVSEQAELVMAIAEENGGLSFNWKKTKDERDALWRARHDAYYASLMLRPNARVWTTDACVPIASLSECINRTKEDLKAVSFPATIVGHVGDGNYHVLCVLDPDSTEELAQAEELSEKIVRRAQSLGGTCTGEHGIGYGKLKHLEAEHGAGLDVLRSIKAALDPENRMNPGKMLPII